MTYALVVVRTCTWHVERVQPEGPVYSLPTRCYVQSKHLHRAHSEHLALMTFRTMREVSVGGLHVDRIIHTG